MLEARDPSRGAFGDCGTSIGGGHIKASTAPSGEGAIMLKGEEERASQSSVSAMTLKVPLMTSGS